MSVYFVNSFVLTKISRHSGVVYWSKSKVPVPGKEVGFIQPIISSLWPKLCLTAGQLTEVAERSNLRWSITTDQIYLGGWNQACVDYCKCRILWWYQFQYCAISSSSNWKWIDNLMTIYSNKLKSCIWGFSTMENSLAKSI